MFEEDALERMEVGSLIGAHAQERRARTTDDRRVRGRNETKMAALRYVLAALDQGCTAFEIRSAVDAAQSHLDTGVDHA
jgi:hypothetical protein